MNERKIYVCINKNEVATDQSKTTSKIIRDDQS